MTTTPEHISYPDGIEAAPDAPECGCGNDVMGEGFAAGAPDGQPLDQGDVSDVTPDMVVCVRIGCGRYADTARSTDDRTALVLGRVSAEDLAAWHERN